MKKCKLGECIDVKRGTSLSGDYYSEQGEKIRLTLGNFNYPGGGFKANTSKTDIYFTGVVKPEFILNEGDIITPLTEQVAGLLGETAKIPQSNLYIQSGDIGLVIPDETKIDRNYIYYLLSSQPVKKQLGAGAQQTKIRHTSPEKIKDCEVLLPDLSTQKLFGNVLASIDEQIQRNNDMVHKLQVLAQTTYSRWFHQFEFPNEHGLPYKSSGGKMVWSDEVKREIPDGWQIKTLCLENGLCKFQKGKIPEQLFEEKKTNCDKYLTLDAIANTDIQYCNITNMPYCYGYTLMVMDGAASGDVYVQKYGILGSTFAMLIPTDSQLNINNFIYLYLTCNKSIYIKANTGSTVPHANRCFIENMKVLIPDNFELFLNTINPLFEQIRQVEDINVELNSLKCQLLPLLINGQLQV